MTALSVTMIKGHTHGLESLDEHGEQDSYRNPRSVLRLSLMQVMTGIQLCRELLQNIKQSWKGWPSKSRSSLS